MAVRTEKECIDCFKRQTAATLRFASCTDGQERIMKLSLAMLAGIDFEESPPEFARRLYEMLHRETGQADPYGVARKRFNGIALAMEPRLREIMDESADPFQTAVRLAIAGNIIDFGIHPDVDERRIDATIAACLGSDVDVSAVGPLKVAAQEAKSILYLCDNAGEIVFDKLLIERLGPQKVTAAVKAGPIINDVLAGDAKDVGLADMVEVIDNGTAAPGTILGLCSDEFRRRFDGADLVVSKGQGNFETLWGTQANIFYLFTVKCPVVSRLVGKPMGSSVVMREPAGY